ncbi:MAG: 30S ribosomal protein S6 [Pseudomonadota bacterium]
MPLYEHVFMTRQDVSNAQVEGLTKEYTDILAENGGKVVRSEYWGLKSLAYKIKKNRKAHYTMLNIDAPHAAMAEMERRMSLSTDIIRFLTLKVDTHEADLSVMMRKNDRDDRRDNRGGPGGRGGPRGGDRGGPRGGGGDRGSTFRSRPDGDRPPPRGDRPPRDNTGSEA